MPDYIGKMLSIMGPTATIVPLGLPPTLYKGQSIGENVAKTTVTSVHGGSGVNAVFTYYPGARTAWTKPTYYSGRSRIPVLPFNGSTEYLDSPDADFWTMLTGVDDDCPMSLSAWVNVTDTAAVRGILAKSNAGVDAEWVLAYTGADIIQTYHSDISAGTFMKRDSDAGGTQGRLINLAMTYDGGGGATAANGMALFMDGVAIASTATNNASYVSKENKLARMGIGTYVSAAGAAILHFSGLIYGGALGPAVEKAAWTAGQVSMLHAVGREALKGEPMVRKLWKGM